MDCKLTLRSDKKSSIWIYILNSRFLFKWLLIQPQLVFLSFRHWYPVKWCLLCAQFCASENNILVQMHLQGNYTRLLIHRIQLSRRWLTVMVFVLIHAWLLKLIWIHHNGVCSLSIILPFFQLMLSSKGRSMWTTVFIFINLKSRTGSEGTVLFP